MAQRFIIDINVNGAQSQGDTTQGNNLAVGAVAAKTLGVQTSNMRGSTGRVPGGMSDQYIGEGFGDSFTKKQLQTFNQEGAGFTPGRLQSPFQRQYSTPGGGLIESGETTLGAGVGAAGVFYRNNAGAIKTLGVAAAWKAANTMIDLKNYKSGDTAANAQRSNAMRGASYGAALIATGFNPALVIGIVGNELINFGVENEKWKYERKLDRIEITNITAIAGDISYGRRRGGM